MAKSDIALVNYTRKQEIANSASHALGIAMGIFALVFCTQRSLAFHSARVTAAAIIYGLSLIVMFTASTVYHALTGGQAKKAARMLDHCMVFLIIAGTATPCTLVTLYSVSSFHCKLVFSVAWISAILGIASTVLFFEKSKPLRMILLIGEGALMISSVLPIASEFNTEGYALLWLGCGLFLIGAVLFGLGRKHAILHTVFHVFVLAGVAVHLFSIAKYVFALR